MRKLAMFLATAVALTTVTACGKSSDDSATSIKETKQQYPVTVSSGNHSTTVDTKPTRIVSLSPTATEDLFAINAGTQVVAVDNQSTYPTTAPKTDLSGFTPNIEAILSYKPDLVVAQTDTNGMVNGLEQAHVKVLLQPSASNFDDVYKQFADLGALTDHAVDATKVTTDIRKKIDAKVAEAGTKAKGKTYYHEVDDTNYSATSSTFIGHVYSLFGLVNIADTAATAGNQYPQLSSEYIVSKNPNYIFLADTKCCKQSPAAVGARPGWSNLDAVKANHVVALDDDIASRWGPRITDLVDSVGNAVK